MQTSADNVKESVERGDTYDPDETIIEVDGNTDVENNNTLNDSLIQGATEIGGGYKGIQSSSEKAECELKESDMPVQTRNVQLMCSDGISIQKCRSDRNPRKRKGYNLDGSKRVGRLLLDDALKLKDVNMTGWSKARKFAFKRIKENPNSTSRVRRKANVDGRRRSTSCLCNSCLSMVQTTIRVCSPCAYKEELDISAPTTPASW